MTRIRANNLYGTVSLLILQTLHRVGPVHGLGVAEEIRRLSGHQLQLEEGALYPALHRLEKEGLIKGEWRISDKRQRARFYRLTAAGRRELERELQGWVEHLDAVRRVLGLVWADLP
jgi:PadR family transcriptional regulator PadR